MKKATKLKSLVLGVSLGLGGLMSGYSFSSPDLNSCITLKQQCEATGEVGLCAFYHQQCAICETNPSMCSYTKCNVNGNEDETNCTN